MKYLKTHQRFPTKISIQTNIILVSQIKPTRLPRVVEPPEIVLISPGFFEFPGTA